MIDVFYFLLFVLGVAMATGGLMLILDHFGFRPDRDPAPKDSGDEYRWDN